MTILALVALIALTLILARWLTQLWLDWLNQHHVLAHGSAVPEALKGSIDAATYFNSVQYTVAKIRFERIETTYSTAILVTVLFSGVLPVAFEVFTKAFGTSAWAMAAFLFAISLALTLPGLPFDWYAQFRLEERFGFNTTTQQLWWLDRLKSILLALALGYPLLVLMIQLIEWTGGAWWLWAWGCVLAFQLLMLVVSPVLILPLFNKFSPLPEGTLYERLLRLATRTGFRAKSIQVMDGSKRSRHSNAFFTGFGRFRKIVLFDTLIQHLSEVELEAVLAHEIGHYKKGHVPKMLLGSAVALLAGFCILAWLAERQWLYRAFGFEAGNKAPAFLIFALLSGAITFWLSPLANFWSRRYEYQADRYAVETLGETRPLVGALRKLNEKNLSNLTPHPLYSWFYYSHPTLLEREKALQTVS